MIFTSSVSILPQLRSRPLSGNIQEFSELSQALQVVERKRQTNEPQLSEGDLASSPPSLRARRPSTIQPSHIYTLQTHTTINSLTTIR